MQNRPWQSYCSRFLGFVVAVFLLGAFIFIPHPVLAQSENDKLEDLQAEIAELTQKLSETQQEKNTLSANIQYLNNKIALNEKEIEKTQYEIQVLNAQINDLGQRITGLQASLGDLSEALIDRVQAQYKRRATDPISMVFATTGLSDFFKEHKYYQQVRTHTQELLLTTELKRQVYDEEKTNKEVKQIQMEALQNQLQSQQRELGEQQTIKRNLLAETQNNERIFQQKLEQLRAEMEAINAVIAGQGDETEVGGVNAGDRIASVIQGTSCNSGGTHLHFTVRKGSSSVNPFEYLGAIDHVNCSGASCGGSGDPFNPSGSWSWPISGPVRFSQGYGVTWAVRNTWVSRIYSFHNGIDINSSDPTVRAVSNGTLFRGSYTGSGGCRLRYVRVAHNDSDISSFYLHINY